MLSALGQAFFSLSIAIGCLSTYASYFKADVPLLKTAANVVGIDTLVAVMSGFIIFPAVFSVPGVTPDAGPGLVFVTLPNIFSNLFGGAPAGLPLLADVLSAARAGGAHQRHFDARGGDSLLRRSLQVPRAAVLPPT